MNVGNMNEYAQSTASMRTYADFIRTCDHFKFLIFVERIHQPSDRRPVTMVIKYPGQSSHNRG